MELGKHTFLIPPEQNVGLVNIQNDRKVASSETCMGAWMRGCVGAWMRGCMGERLMRVLFRLVGSHRTWVDECGAHA